MKKLFFVAVAVLFSGCVEYTEELWFNADMSGRIKVNIKISEKLAKLSEEAGRRDNIFSEEGIYNRFGDVDELRLIEAKAYTEDENRFSSFILAFNSLESLKKLSNVKKETDFFGKISIGKTDDGRFSFTRTVVMGDKIKYKMVEQMMSQFTWTYTVHFPGKILEVNASASSYNTKDNSVTWVYSLKDLTKGPRTMKVFFAAPGKFDFIALAVAGIVFIVVFGVLYRVLRKRI